MSWLMKLSVAMVLVSGLGLVKSPEDKATEALESYDEAFRTKNVEAIETLLSEDVLLYEHSVRNAGREDVFENHLKPEILEFHDMKLEFSDVRITPGQELMLVTRQYTLQGTYEGREIDASGNETMVWKKTAGEWKVAHIHYSHSCPGSAESAS